MIYKKALYVFSIYNDAGDLLLYNMRNSKTLKIRKNLVDFYKSIVEKDEIIIDDIKDSILLAKLPMRNLFFQKVLMK